MKKVEIEIALYAVYIAVAVMIATLAYLVKDTPAGADLVKPEIEKVYAVEIIKEKPVASEVVYVEKIVERVADAQPEQKAPAVMITDNELELLAGVIHAEAGNQDETGKRLVADVVLNRVNDARFPDSIAGVITQAGQFEQPAGFTADEMRIAESEMVERLDTGVLWFRTGEYHKYGTPLYQHGAHYFSGGGTMRGFKDTKQPSQPMLGDAVYGMMIKAQKTENERTEEAKRRFMTPAYCIGERRRKYDSAICGNEKSI